ncbi:MAG: stress response translation initiation inhibitor YciH [Euryarchaeota archaeon]|nr:stress response translation initiation inhibitor YciH [Euryarchaeota archaeon]
MAICDKCGLPDDLCVCEEIVKESQVVRLSASQRRFGKWMTIIEGIDSKSINIKNLSKELKTKCACGGTIKDDTIELQGNQKDRVRKIMEDLGYTVMDLGIRRD